MRQVSCLTVDGCCGESRYMLTCSRQVPLRGTHLLVSAALLYEKLTSTVEHPAHKAQNVAYWDAHEGIKASQH